MSYIFVNRGSRLFAAAVVCLGLMASNASAIVTSYGTVWDHEPDAWTRGNNADTSYFGWDLMDTLDVPFHEGVRILDNSAPDLGTGITATGVRIYQGADGYADPTPTANGHLAGSGNYYSLFDVSNDTITATAPASGVGGYTTVVLQLIASPLGGPLKDIEFAMDNTNNTWTLQKELFNLNSSGYGQYWREWTTNAASPTFKINFTSSEQHRGIDAFQIDTFWNATAPAVNSITTLPEPAAGLMAAIGLIGALAPLRRRVGN